MIYPQRDERLLNDILHIPPDLLRWWRRMTMERSKLTSVTVMVSKNGKVTWAVMSSGKLENEE